MAQRARARALIAALALLAAFIWVGCDRQPGDAIAVTWTIDPAPPVTGASSVARLTLRDQQQRPIRGAKLRLEAQMSHPGMAPVIATVAERGDGIYEAPFQFTMAGDWTLVLTGEIPDGTRITKHLEVAGVRPGS